MSTDHLTETASGGALPQDPAMLLSYINTQLRDQYSSLEELCRALGIEENVIRKSLASIDYEYEASLNRFV